YAAWTTQSQYAQAQNTQTPRCELSGRASVIANCPAARAAFGASVASARVRRQPSRNRTAAFLPFILHHVQERCWNGQAHELTRIGDNIDDSPVDRRANRTLIQLGACFLELSAGGVASRLGLSSIFLARSRPQQDQPGSRLRELRGKDPRVLRGLAAEAAALFSR